MNRAQALSKLNRSDMRNAAAERGTQRIFAWNRAHWIGMVVLIAVLLLLQWSSSMYLMPDEVLDRAAKNLFVWFPGMVLHWPLVLGITNLILGSTRSGSLSFPLASAIIGPLAFGWTNLRLRPGFPYRSWAQWWKLMHAESGHQLLVHSLIGSAMLLICYTAVAFICYAIGRYGLRELFVDPNPQTASGRLLTWIRQDAIRFGCWLATAIMYGLLLALTLRGGMAAMAAALLINFVIPPALLVINGIYALRPASLTYPWKSLLFPLACTLVPAPMLMALITVYEDTCPIGSTCTLIGDRYLSWGSMDQVLHFVIVFAVASFLGFGVVWAVRWIVARRTK